MTFEQLSALIKADFSADQIRAVSAIFDGNPSPAPAPTPAPAPAATPAPNPNPTPAPSVQPPAEDAGESETQKMIAEMLGLMKKGFVNTVSQPAPKAEQTAEDILIAAVLNP